MRLVLQRVKMASVEVEDHIIGRISAGLLLFLGIAEGDTEEITDVLVRKILSLRIFEDQHGKMNLSLKETKGQILIVSQFTLYADLRKGRRPSFDQAAKPQTAEHLYNYFVEHMRAQKIPTETGQFGAAMNVTLVNDGPVTFVLDSRDFH